MATLSVTAKTGDVGVYKTGSITWATIHDAAAGTDVRTTTAIVSARNPTADVSYTVERGFEVFDTSALGTGITISAATLTLTGTSTKTDAGSSYNIYNTTCADPPTVNDYGSVGTTAYATAIAGASWNDAGANVFTLNAAGIAAINPTGVTKMSIRDVTKDAANVAPGINDSDLILYKLVGFGSNPPQLDITYATTVATVAPNSLALLGVGT